MKRVSPRFKLWLNSKKEQGIFGDGKWRLLQAIEKEGSLSSACKLLDISYRKAWGDLKKAERGLGVSLMEKHRGGKLGGRTILTDSGKRWLKAYGKFRAGIQKAIQRAYDKHIKELTE
jgi:molybdate transport system regulatory protein